MFRHPNLRALGQAGISRARTTLSSSLASQQSWSRALSSTAPRHSRQRLVILGSGWGGYNVLRGVDKKRWDVIIISPSTYFNFTPLLASTAVGTLEFRCAIEPVRRYSPKTTMYQAWCDSIDFQKKMLVCTPATPLTSRFERPQVVSAAAVPPTPDQSGAAPHPTPATQIQTYALPSSHFTINYDKLVIAVGCYAQTFNIPGVKEHAYFLKNIQDARAIRSRVLECFEVAAQPTLSDVERRNILSFRIVGAGPTGVEFAAELHDLLSSDIRRHYGEHLSRLARITLYDVANRVLSAFDGGLALYAERKFARDGINVKLRHHVDKVEDGLLYIKGQGAVPFGMLVWATGLAPSPLIKSITELQKDPKTESLLTDSYLHVINADGTVNEDVWAIGDAAMIKDVFLPATAQVASQKAYYVTKVVNRLVRERPPPEQFHFRNQGSLAYLGNWEAVYDRTNAETGPKAKQAGRIAWLLWRSAYFTKTLSIRNKITVSFYWFLNWIFGRDITKL